VDVRTTSDICVWIEDYFEYHDHRVVKVKEDFINQVFNNSYVIDGKLGLEACLIVKEFDAMPNLGNAMLDCPQKILDDVASLHKEIELSDFTFFVEKEEFPVHKALLAARSPVFFKMFTVDMQEKSGKMQEILDIGKEAFEEFLRFIYTGEVVNLEENVEDLLVLADRYEVSDLQKVCESNLLTNLNVSNAKEVFQIAHRYSCDVELKKASFDMLQTLFARLNISMPDEFIDKPAKVQQVVEVRQNLEDLLRPENP